MSLLREDGYGVDGVAASPSRASLSGSGSGSASPFWSQPFLALRLAALWLVLLAVFHLSPGLDRFVSALFLTRVACPDGAAATMVCGDFAARSDLHLAAVRRLFHYAPAILAVALTLLLARARGRSRGLAPRARLAACALAAFALGPGLLVNGILKDFWGRPRPVATDLFGGALPFVPAGEWSDACAANCSFVSGEASTIAWLFCLVPLLPRRLRAMAAASAGTAVLCSIALRVAFGGHYLSDVVLGALSTIVIFAALLRYVEWAVAGAGRSPACGEAAS